MNSAQKPISFYNFAPMPDILTLNWFPFMRKITPYSLFMIPALFFLSCTYLRETPSYREVPKEQWKIQKAAAAADPTPAMDYAALSRRLGYTLQGHENRLLLEEILRWLGTPYRYGGTTGAGMDCSGFVIAVYRNVYSVDLSRVTLDMVRESSKIKKNRLREGDLVFFRIDKRKISHVGIFISEHKFAHASTSRGVIISDLREPYYEQRFAFGGRVKK